MTGDAPGKLSGFRIHLANIYRLAVQVRNKLIEAYQEISRMQI